MPDIKMKPHKRTRAPGRGDTVLRALPKTATGIRGLDEITGGGLPKGRPTLVCGGAGCGKTVLAMEFLVRGAMQFREPGVFLSFEETAEELAQNVASMGFDLKALMARKQLLIDYVRVERSEIEETGEYDLEGLFIRLGHAIDSIGAKRVVLDTAEALFGGFANAAVLRAELRRLFGWLKAKKVTAIITGERGAETLTRQGLEEYVSDCVVLLDHRVSNQLTIRRMRIVKYRGTVHGTDEYPYLIGEHGVVVLPITSLSLQHEASTERLSSGVAVLDTMLGAQGFFRGSTVLVSGTTGTGKSSLAAHFVAAACGRGERCLYVAAEESPSQILRDMRSIGIELAPYVASGFLQFHASRPTAHGLELHLVSVQKLVEDFRPRVVVVDSITSYLHMGVSAEVMSMVVRLVDFLKTHQITLFMTSLIEGGSPSEMTGADISSLVDAWLSLRNLETNGARVRTLSILKARGMAHSNQTHEFALTGKGVEFKRPASAKGGS
jgi:circadian clock protein KaiC